MFNGCQYFAIDDVKILQVLTTKHISFFSFN